MTSTPNLPTCWKQLQQCIDSGVNRILLYGPPGTGKTYSGLKYGNVSAGAHRLICTEDMTSFDVTGGFMPGSDGFQWLYGAGIKAWEGNGINGGRLVVDEIDKAGGDVFATLLSILDSEDSAEWQHPETGRIHRPRPGFSAVMTTNIEDMDELPVALVDRFPVQIRINEPHPDALELLSLDLRSVARNLADAGPRRVSLRAFMTFDQLRKSIGTEESAQIIFKDRAESILDAMKVEKVS
jgi:MoxR-like ATPase